MARFFPALAAAALFLCAARIGVINALEGDACDFYAHAVGGMKCTLGLPGNLRRFVSCEDAGLRANASFPAFLTLNRYQVKACFDSIYFNGPFLEKVYWSYLGMLKNYYVFFDIMRDARASPQKQANGFDFSVYDIKVDAETILRDVMEKAAAGPVSFTDGYFPVVRLFNAMRDAHTSSIGDPGFSREVTNRFRVRLLNEDLSALYNSMHIYPSENMDGTFQYRIPVQGPNGTIGFEYKTITGIQGRPPVDFYKFLAESDAFKYPTKH